MSGSVVTRGTIGPALGSMGVAGATVVILNFGYRHFTGSDFPSDVTAALATLLSAAAHVIQDKFLGGTS